MTHAPILDKYILELLPRCLENLDIIDVASGYGSWGFHIRTRAKGSPNIIGLDIWLPYIERLYPLKIYNNMICADVRKLPIRENSFDIVLACEVLEHITKSEGKEVLDELERLARRMIIITTPLGFTYQGDVDENIFQRHVSAWTGEEFEERGYSVRTIDAIQLKRILKFVDKIRRFIFRLSPPPKEIISIKKY